MVIPGDQASILANEIYEEQDDLEQRPNIDYAARNLAQLRAVQDSRNNEAKLIEMER